MVKENAGSSRESSIASGWTVEGQSAEPPASEDAVLELGSSETFENDESTPQQLSAGALVLLGLIGGVFLLYTMVWFSWANAKSVENSLVAGGSGSIGAILQQIVFWMAPVAPGLWFMSVLVLCRDSKLGKKLLWLLVGAAVLVPLPMFGGLFL